MACKMDFEMVLYFANTGIGCAQLQACICPMPSRPQFAIRALAASCGPARRLHAANMPAAAPRITTEELARLREWQGRRGSPSPLDLWKLHKGGTAGRAA